MSSSSKRSRKSIHYLFVGNPGVGKSTLLNGLYKAHVHEPHANTRVLFKSGVSYGSGLTSQLDVQEGAGNIYMDTPGLADRKKRQQAAEAITEGLRKDGDYKVVFVVTQMQGRVVSDDVTTMNLVIKAADLTKYGIIINQVPEPMCSDLRVQESDAFQSFKEDLLSEFDDNHKSDSIYVMPFNDSLQGKNDVAFCLADDVLEFIDSVPTIHIAKEKVQDIRGEDFEALKGMIERQLREMEEQRREMEEQRRKMEEQRREMESQQSLQGLQEADLRFKQEVTKEVVKAGLAIGAKVTEAVMEDRKHAREAQSRQMDQQRVAQMAQMEREERRLDAVVHVAGCAALKALGC